MLKKVGLSVVFLISLTMWACSRKASPETLVRAVEADFQEISVQLYSYANNHKRFPLSLQVFPEKTINTADWPSINTQCRRNYGYAVSADGLVAILVSVGIDGQPDTPDDYVKVLDLRLPEKAKTEATPKALLRSVYGSWPCAQMKKL